MLIDFTKSKLTDLRQIHWDETTVQRQAQFKSYNEIASNGVK